MRRSAVASWLLGSACWIVLPCGGPLTKTESSRRPREALAGRSLAALQTSTSKDVGSRRSSSSTRVTLSSSASGSRSQTGRAASRFSNGSRSGGELTLWSTCRTALIARPRSRRFRRTLEDGLLGRSRTGPKGRRRPSTSASIASSPGPTRPQPDRCRTPKRVRQLRRARDSESPGEGKERTVVMESACPTAVAIRCVALYLPPMTPRGWSPAGGCLQLVDGLQLSARWKIGAA